MTTIEMINEYVDKEFLGGFIILSTWFVVGSFIYGLVG